MERSVPIIVISCIVILCCCLCGVLLVAAGVISGMDDLEFGDSYSLDTPQPTPIVVRPDSKPIDIPQDTLTTLETTEIPENDLLDLARRLGGIANIPQTLEPPSAFLQVGAQDTFWVTDTDGNQNFQIEASLRYVTDHAYFWLQSDLGYNERDLEALAETFEEQIYPTNRAFFGSEWTPGVDGDPHLYIVFAQGLGHNLAGYFSSADEYHPLAHEYSNGHELFLLNADNLDLGEEYTYGVLAHEFQHMIHWYQDRNETTWLNEGFSELASFLNGYDAGGFDDLYASDPDMQLNDWPNDPSRTSSHYGASFLFVTYFLDRFGETATQALVSHAANGMSSVDLVLDELDISDPLTNEEVGADDVFIDWVLASYLTDKDIADGRYFYHNYADAPRANGTEQIKSCPTDVLTRDVHQYGVDYIRIDCAGDYRLHFEGSTQVGVLPVEPHRGEFAFWSNKGDESDMTLTRSFDFREVTGPLTLDYWVWYDLEEDYDYVYLEVSQDDGETWQILTTPSGTAEDPSGNSYGWGYNGQSGGDGSWILEQVDLSRYAGEQVQLRFEYITDAAVNGEGFLLDTLSIPEIGYATDFEEDSGGWEAAGFVRIENALPQFYRLALISHGKTTQVEYLDLDPDNTLDIPVRIGGDVDDVTLVVTGTTRFTRQKASYRYQIIP